MAKKEEVVSFGEILKSRYPADDEEYERTSTRELVGKEFTIENVVFADTSAYGEVVFFYTEDKKRFMTSSKVLMEQGKDIKKYRDEGKKVRVKLKRIAAKDGKYKYLSFAPPEE